jgi:hypothetical protein
MDKDYAGDRLMDTVSGLEGLLVSSENESGHKLSERVALLLEKDPQKRISLLKEMKEAYKLRSDVAHGNKVADFFDSIVTPFHQQNLKDKVKNQMRALTLYQKTQDSLHKAILICIEEQTADFDWDSTIMGTEIDLRHAKGN